MSNTILINLISVQVTCLILFINNFIEKDYSSVFWFLLLIVFTTGVSSGIYLEKFFNK